MDWYEPNEPALEAAGLPWFFFIAGPDHVVDDMREQFLAEAAAFWSEPSADSRPAEDASERTDRYHGQRLPSGTVPSHVEENTAAERKRPVDVTWEWTRLEEDAGGPRIVVQLHEFGCGAACAVMLLADRDLHLDQLEVQAGLHLPSTAAQLSRRLNALSGGRHRWEGGQLDLDPP